MISLIAVIGKNRELGCNNQLLWKLPQDMQRFKQLTWDHPVLMGRKTFQSIGRPLPGRKNIIVTSQKDFEAPGCEVVNSLEDFLKQYKDNKEGQEKSEEVFVIGGGSIYEQSLPYADKLYLTIVDDAPEADVYFPKYEEAFSEVTRKEEGIDNGLRYAFLELETIG
jgi:dihydrofolate reductase